MDILWKIKPFETLTTAELYNLLKIRNEVFIVEQNCVYQDVDSKDQKAYHILGELDGIVVAYARLFKSKDYFDEASIGRVLVKQTHRNFKLGNLLMERAIYFISSELGEIKITISAQLYLKFFYESHGFIPTSDTYLEDDIPHIAMKRG